VTTATAPEVKAPRKRTRAKKPETPAAEVPAQAEQPVQTQPPGGPALSAAASRRASALDQLRRTLDSMERSRAATIANMMAAGSAPAVRERMLAQYDEGRNATLEKIAQAEALTGWELIERYAPECRPPEPQPDPDAWKAGLVRGPMLPKGQVGAVPEMVAPGYLAEYEARRAAWEADDRAGAAARARQLAG